MVNILGKMTQMTTVDNFKIYILTLSAGLSKNFLTANIQLRVFLSTDLIKILKFCVVPLLMKKVGAIYSALWSNMHSRVKAQGRL